MAAGIGQNVELLDFTSIKNKIDTIFGVGANDYGYGQISAFNLPPDPGSSAPLSGAPQPGSIITAQHWALLRTDLVKARQHQTGVTIGTALTNDGFNLAVVEAGQVMTESVRQQYSSFVNTVEFYRYNIAPSQFTRSILAHGVRNTGWNGIVTHEIVVTGGTSGNGSAENLRYFFNAGGKISFSPSRTGGSQTSKNIFWSTFLSQIGTIELSHHDTFSSGASGTSADFGYNSLTTSNSTIFSATGTGTYALNTVVVAARLSSNRSSIIFTVTFSDNSIDGQFDQIVTGQLVNDVNQILPTGNNVAIASLTATHSGIDAGIAIAEYKFTSNVTAVNEGSSVVFTIESNEATARRMYWSTSGDIDGSDFTDNSTVGSVDLDNNGNGTITRTLVNDLMTEGAERFLLQLRIGSTGGPIVATSPSIVINDTSRYSFSINTTSIREGESVTYTVNSSSVANGRQLYASISGNVIAEDFEGGFSARSVVIYNGTASGTIRTLTDSLNDPGKYFKIVFTDSRGMYVGETPYVTIIDTSPSYRIQAQETVEYKNLTHTSSSVGTLTVAAGVTSMDATVVGGGGGAGGSDTYAGHDGFSGDKVVTTISVSSGNVLQFAAGAGGENGWKGTGIRGGYGGANGLGFAGGNGGTSGGTGSSGSGGGGGGASAIYNGSTPLVIAAGGGGGGGGSKSNKGFDRLSTYSSGQDYFRDGITYADKTYYSAVNTNTNGGTGNNKIGYWYPIYKSTYNTFTNTYGVWCGAANQVATRTASQVISFPVSGNYTFLYTGDNTLKWDIDGGTVTKVTDKYKSTVAVPQSTVALTAGNHTLNISIANSGSAGAVAFQILKPDGSELWNSRNFSGGLTLDGAGGGGGGGGYPTGGAGGPARSIGDTGGFSGEKGKSYSVNTATVSEYSNAGVNNSGGSGYIYLSWAEPRANYLPAGTAFGEGSTVNYKVSTTNIADGTVLYVTPVGSIDSSDFVNGFTGNTVTIYNNTATGALTIQSDTVAEAEKSFALQLRSDGPTGTVVATSDYYKINAAGSKEFNTAGTYSWTVPSGVSQIQVLVNGAGGGAGGSHGGCDHPDEHHGGKGGGGYTSGTVSMAVTPGQTISIYVAAGGKGGGTGSRGADALTSSVSGTTTISAAGGKGGGGGSGDGAGGTGAGGSIANGGKYRVSSGASGYPGGDGYVKISWS